MKSRAMFLLLWGCFQVSLGQQFRIDLSVTDGVGTQRLTFGIHPNGTNGFNAGLDTLAPPPGPSGSFDARLRFPEAGGSEDYFVDMRGNAFVPDTFYVHYAASSSATGPVTVSWDLLQLDNQANSFTITDNINGSLFTMNMKLKQRIRADTASGLVANSFRLIITPPYPAPVQLVSFTATVVNQSRVRLDWRTISEINNYGFYVERKRVGDTSFTEIPNSFISGYGTTNEPHDYTFTDQSPGAPSVWYRLRQVDLDGSVHYTDPIQASGITSVEGKEVAPMEFALKQNYPNPFNPSTEIKFSVGTTDRATLDVYNVLGQKVATLFDDVAEAGQYYKVRFEARNLASGIYLYRLVSGKQSTLKKFLLLK